jgi:hypothetical protein
MQGRGYLRFKTASCCRRAKFSKRRSRRERKNTITGAGKSFTRHSIRAVLHGDSRDRMQAHFHDSTADRYFGEPQATLAEIGRRLGRKVLQNGSEGSLSTTTAVPREYFDHTR